MQESVQIIDCLGQPFAPGGLYNISTGLVMSGLRLGDAEKKDGGCRIVDHGRRFNTMDFSDNESFDEHSDSMNISGSFSLNLKMSFGIDISGSYSSKSKSKNDNKSVTLVYKCVSEVKEFYCPADQIEHYAKRILKIAPSATHFIACVEYGGEVTMEFTDSEQSSSSETKLSGSFKLEIEKLALTGSVAASGEIDETNKQRMKNIHCKFTSDILIEKLPTNMLDALIAIRNLEVKRARTPLKAYILPLNFSKSESTLSVPQNVTQNPEFHQFEDYCFTLNQMYNVAVNAIEFFRNTPFVSLVDKLKTFKNEIFCNRRDAIDHIDKISSVSEHDDDGDMSSVVENLNNTEKYKIEEMLVWIRYIRELMPVVKIFTDSFLQIENKNNKNENSVAGLSVVLLNDRASYLRFLVENISEWRFLFQLSIPDRFVDYHKIVKMKKKAEAKKPLNEREIMTVCCKFRKLSEEFKKKTAVGSVALWQGDSDELYEIKPRFRIENRSEWEDTPV